MCAARRHNPVKPYSKDLLTADVRPASAAAQKRVIPVSPKFAYRFRCTSGTCMCSFHKVPSISKNTAFFIFSLQSVSITQRISLARFSALERFAKRYFPYRELRILAERFCVIGTKFPITQKTPRGLNSLYQPARCLATCGFYFKYPVTLCAWRWCSSRNAQCSREFHDHLPGKSECRGSSWKKSGR